VGLDEVSSKSRGKGKTAAEGALEIGGNKEAAHIGKIITCS